MALTLSEIEPAVNADDQQWSRTIGYVDLKCFLRVDDDDVSITVIVRRPGSRMLDETLMAHPFGTTTMSDDQCCRPRRPDTQISLSP
jgi:hypothetical protein